MAQDTVRLSAWSTVKSELDSLPIVDGQMIFVRDTRYIAFDFDGQRKLYTQIVELTTEQDRLSILAPIVGSFYYITETNALWTYQSSQGWVQVTLGDISGVLNSLSEIREELTIDYDLLSFDTSEIVIGNESSAVLGVAILGQMRLA